MARQLTPRPDAGWLTGTGLCREKLSGVRGQGSGKNVEWTLPTILIIPAFHSLGVSQRPMNDCLEKLLRIWWHRLSSLCGPPGGRGGPPHQPFHTFRVGQRPMNNCKLSVASAVFPFPSATWERVREILTLWPAPAARQNARYSAPRIPGLPTGVPGCPAVPRKNWPAPRPCARPRASPDPGPDL